MTADGESLLWQLCAGREEDVTAELVSQAADKGDKLAQRIWEETGHYLGTGLASVATLLNPEKNCSGRWRGSGRKKSCFAPPTTNLSKAGSNCSRH